ncbi:BON domain-containing protein [Pararobbsia silviterrae]|uniref:BON domain-containing protein n=1 Tax=Pararobbsia silviterrae TaxID=1792498 RepID=A0A494XT29_9BURK|nr:BON domain-containing protein [Pararobbsia silviterrae]RKP53767.1 BON domain-containing protein [Pararobbsia silviterrae]
MKMQHRISTACVAATLSLYLVFPAFAQGADAASTASADAAGVASPVAGSKKSVRAANRAFSKRVKKALAQTKGLESALIVVFADAKTGAVTLTGQVENAGEDRLAVEAAKKVSNVTSVTSKLTLKTQTE